MGCGDRVFSLTPSPFFWQLKIPLGSRLAAAKEELFFPVFPVLGLLRRKNHLLLNHALWLVVSETSRSQSEAALDGVFVQADILDRGTDNG